MVVDVIGTVGPLRTPVVHGQAEDHPAADLELSSEFYELVERTDGVLERMVRHDDVEMVVGEFVGGRHRPQSASRSFPPRLRAYLHPHLVPPRQLLQEVPAPAAEVA